MKQRDVGILVHQIDSAARGNIVDVFEIGLVDDHQRFPRHLAQKSLEGLASSMAACDERR